jgi:hypothetical protein
MTHPTDLLVDFVAGRLPDEAASPVAAHLARCPGCARDAAGWHRVAGAIADRAGAVAAPPPGLLDAVLARLPAEGGPRPAAGARAVLLDVPRYAEALGSLAPARALRILAHQRRLVDWRVWVVAGAVLALGAGLAALAPPGLSGQVLAMVVPLVAALAVAGVCGNGADPADELVAATPTGVRIVLLARLTLVLGGIFAAASVATLALGWFDAGASTGLLAAWVGPMALLAAVSFALSVLWRPAVGIGTATALWVLRLLAGSGSLDGMVVRAVEPLWLTSGPVLLAAGVLVAGTVALLPYVPAGPVRTYGR